MHPQPWTCWLLATGAFQASAALRIDQIWLLGHVPRPCAWLAIQHVQTDSLQTDQNPEIVGALPLVGTSAKRISPSNLVGIQY